jgi:AraC-like DNA-binding protein
MPGRWLESSCPPVGGAAYYAWDPRPKRIRPVPRPRLDAEQFAPGIAPQMFVGLLELTEELGVAPQRLCTGLGCSIEGLRRGEQISNRQAWRMIRRALRLTGRADLGLELGVRENFSHFGLPGSAMSAARTFSDALEIGMRYQNQTGGISSSSVECSDNHVAVIVDSNLHDKSVLPFVIEEYFASALVIVRQLVGDRFHLHSLEVAYPQPAHAERYRQMFECPVYFGCARNRAQMHRRWLSVPIATHSAAMAAQLGVLLEQQAQARALPPRPTVAVEQLLLRSGNARLSIDQVAGALQVSVRTLRRRLNEDGSSFRTLSERVRVEAAERLLTEPGMTVAGAAERLGFSDARAFRRAFKRWLGQVPGRMRPAATPYRARRSPGKSRGTIAAKTGL